MSRAFIDTSCLVAILLDQDAGAGMQERLEECDELLASSLLEAELKSVLRREGVSAAPPILEALSWVVPDRHLGPEIERVLAAGHLRGADCWHVATALFVAGDAAALPFVTLDERQREVAAALGFPA